MNKHKTSWRRAGVVVTIITSVWLITTPALIAASNADQAFSGFDTMVRWAYGGGNDVAVNGSTFNSSLIHVINFLLSFIGVIFLGLMIYAGYLWMVARGNDEMVQKAKRIIREAVTALIIILSARIVTEFILMTIGEATKTST